MTDNEHDRYVHSDIEVAIVQGDTDLFEELIADADITHRSNNGSSLLHKSVNGGNIQIASELVERGIDIDAEDDTGRTALHKALGMKVWEIAELLIECSAEVNTVDNHGMTPLKTVVGHARIDNKFVKLLLEHGADPHLPADPEKSALEMARDLKYSDIVELLEKATEE